MGSYQTTSTADITIQSPEPSPDMEFKYLIILASSIASIAGDARIVFQHHQDFLPRNQVDFEPETTTSITTTSTPVTTPSSSTMMTREEEEEMSSNSLVPLCAGSEDWCDTPADYPDQAILAAALRQNNTLGSLFDSNLLAKVQSRKGFPEFEEFVDDMINICSVTTEYIMPRAAKNKEGEYKYIVNHPEGGEEYVQQVRVNICRAAEQSCGHGLLAGSGLESKCRQEYSDHKLVSLSATGEELQVETFRFPSCCSCYVSQFTEY